MSCTSPSWEMLRSCGVNHSSPLTGGGRKLQPYGVLLWVHFAHYSPLLYWNVKGLRAGVVNSDLPSAKIVEIYTHTQNAHSVVIAEPSIVIRLFHFIPCLVNKPKEKTNEQTNQKRATRKSSYPYGAMLKAEHNGHAVNKLQVLSAGNCLREYNASLLNLPAFCFRSILDMMSSLGQGEGVGFLCTYSYGSLYISCFDSLTILLRQ